MAILSGLLSLGGSLLSGGLNLASQYMTNKTNKELAQQANQITLQNNAWQQQNFQDQLNWQKEQYFDQENYSRALQKELFNREDTSYQRTINDITKSGLSPLAINGTNDSGSVVSQAQVPNANIPELSSINPFQAQSLNFGQFADILARADERALERERLEMEEKKNLSDTEQKELDRKQRQEQFEATMEQTESHFTQQMDVTISQYETVNKQKAEQLKNEKARIENLNATLQFDMDKENARKAEKALQSMTGGKGHTVYISDKAEYEQKYEKWCKEYAKKLEEFANDLSATNTSEARSNSESKGLQAGSQAFASLSGEYSEGSSWSKSNNNLDIASDNRLRAWLAENPMPVHY